MAHSDCCGRCRRGNCGRDLGRRCPRSRRDSTQRTGTERETEEPAARHSREIAEKQPTAIQRHNIYKISVKTNNMNTINQSISFNETKNMCVCVCVCMCVCVCINIYTQ